MFNQSTIMPNRYKIIKIIVLYTTNDLFLVWIAPANHKNFPKHKTDILQYFYFQQ